MVKLLYIFITHQLSYNKFSQNIHAQMKSKNITNYIIIVGNENTHYNEQENTLFVKTNDKYEGLPEKIIKTFKFLSESKIFDKYSHFLKLDEDMVILNDIGKSIYKNINYGGNIQKTEGKRDWHFNRCQKTSCFYNKPYMGKFTPWCKGGYGYIISRKSVNLIKNDNNYDKHIYEDLYIALLLKTYDVSPINIPIQKYIKSPSHNAYC